MVRSPLFVLTTIYVSCSVLLVKVKAQDSTEPECTLCFGGGEYDESKTIGGISCSEFTSNLVGLNQEECESLQMIGYENCGCNTYPNTYCPMCEGSFLNIPEPNRQVPGTQDATCGELLFVRAAADGSCDHARKPAFFCGCPGATEPGCSICGDSTGRLQINNPNATLVVQGVGSAMCHEYETRALLGELNDEQCALVQAKALESCGCIDPNNPPAPPTQEPSTSSEENPDMSPTENSEEVVTPDPTSTDNSSATTNRGIIITWAVALLSFLCFTSYPLY